MSEVLILDYTRTPIGSFNGSLSTVPVTTLGATVIKGLISNTGINPQDIDEIIMGNVLSAGVGQAPARQASLGAGIPNSAHLIAMWEAAPPNLVIRPLIPFENIQS